MSIEHKHMRMDRLGLAVSGICLIHCLGTPFLILFFPFIGGFGALDHWLHIGMALILVPIAVLAVTQGYHHHKKRIVPLLAGLGGALVIFGALYPLVISELWHTQTHSWYSVDVVLTVLGSIALVTCHSLNIWFCRHPKKSKSHGHSHCCH
ncbi:MAG: MerC domain-containing protein [Bdellovibrionales bacterium]|nr:MerC domain-containing protein [Bdellovibrionales bacterium]